MSGHVLIVDAVSTNRIVLKVKLSAAFYETSQAATAEEAIAVARETSPSAVLLGELDGPSIADVVRLFRGHSKTAHLPLLVVLATPNPIARLAALRAGADDVVCKPIDDVVLLSRLRSLQRAREAETELALRESTHKALGLAEAPTSFAHAGQIAFVVPDAQTLDPQIAPMMRQSAHNTLAVTARDVLSGIFERPGQAVPDVFVFLVEDDAAGALALQALPELRTRPETRHAAIIAIAADDMKRTAATLLDMGANDLVRVSDLSLPEMLWRLDKLVLAKHKADRLRDTTRDGLKAAVTDPLTGLFNRRYAMPHLTRLCMKAKAKGRRFAVMVADLDHFKAINDRYGHLIGDAVLRDVAQRLRDQLRAVDMVARLGGEEFLIVMPDTNRRAAIGTAQRLCRLIGDHPFIYEGLGHRIDLTISIGIAMSDKNSEKNGSGLKATSNPMTEGCAEKTAQALLHDADLALYEAKAQGRNTVELYHHAA